MTRFGKSRGEDFKKLERFAAAHDGVEGYIEPRTTTYPQSLLLVARDGDWARAPAPDRARAAAFCRKLGVPFYDAAVVGYPERMRGVRGEPAPDVPSASELEAWYSQKSDHDDRR
ncbi:MAG: oxidoreductase [Actinomycetota bacterium]